MKININSIHFTASQGLIDFSHKKIGKLETYHKQILDSEVIFKVETNQNHNNKTTEIKLNIPQKKLFAKEQSSTFEEGISACTEALRRQLKKLKDK